MKGKDIREWRERMEWTQLALANELEVTEMTVYRWERDKGPIPKSVELALKHIETQMKGLAGKSD